MELRRRSNFERTRGLDIARYSSPGTFVVTAFVTDSEGAKSANKTISIHVFAFNEGPTARFTTTDVVGFVGQPLAFDTSFSTHPQNAIASYRWNFGDGSPFGAGQIHSRVYTAAGSYIATLKVTDANGLVASKSRTIVILPADQIGLFSAFINYKVKWDRN